MPSQYVINTPAHNTGPGRFPKADREAISTAVAKGEMQLGHRFVPCLVSRILFTYPKLRFVPVFREGRHAQRLIVHILRDRVLVLRLDHPKSGSGSWGSAGPQLLEVLFMGILFGVELG